MPKISPTDAPTATTLTAACLPLGNLPNASAAAPSHRRRTDESAACHASAQSQHTPTISATTAQSASRMRFKMPRIIRLKLMVGEYLVPNKSCIEIQMNPHSQLDDILHSVAQPQKQNRRKRTKRSAEDFGSDLLDRSIQRQLTDANPWKPDLGGCIRVIEHRQCALCAEIFIETPFHQSLKRRLDCGHFAHLECQPDPNAPKRPRIPKCRLCKIQHSGHPRLNRVFNPTMQHRSSQQSLTLLNETKHQFTTTTKPPPTRSPTTKARTPRARARRSTR